MTKAIQLTASLEDYLEAIFSIISSKGGVKAKDIARHLHVKAGSVTTALQALAKSHHINYQPYEVITLTPLGSEQAKRIIRKHEVLRDFFVDILGADPKIAEASACKIEHAISDELLERLVSFTEFVQACPRCGSDWIEQFRQFCNESPPNNLDKCQICINSGITNLKRKKRNMSHQSTITTLLNIPNNHKCIVKKLNRRSSATKRLVEMGIGRGSIIEVERVAPLGDPIEIKVKGYHLSIRKEDAKYIEVQEQ